MMLALGVVSMGRRCCCPTRYGQEASSCLLVASLGWSSSVLTMAHWQLWHWGLGAWWNPAGSRGWCRLRSTLVRVVALGVLLVVAVVVLARLRGSLAERAEGGLSSALERPSIRPLRGLDSIRQPSTPRQTPCGELPCSSGRSFGRPTTPALRLRRSRVLRYW